MGKMTDGDGPVLGSRTALARSRNGGSNGRASSAPSSDDQPGAHLNRYRQILWKRRFTVLGGLLLVLGATTAGILLQAPVYRATGMIELRQPGDDIVPVDAMFRASQVSDQHLETQYALLMSPVLARRVAEEVMNGGVSPVDLAEGPLQAGPIGRPGGEMDDAELDDLAAPDILAIRSDEPDDLGAIRGTAESGGIQDSDVTPDLDALDTGIDPEAPEEIEAAPDLRSAVGWIQEGLAIDPLRGSRLVRVSFEAADPELAARVVNTLFSQFSALRVEAARSAVQRLAAQGDTARARLVAAERGLQLYVRENGLLFLESGSGESDNLLHERLQRLQQELTAVEAERYAKEAIYNLLRDGDSGYLDSGVLESLNVRVAELRSEHARLLATFTEDYPRTQQVRRQLDELEDLLTQERGRIVSQIRNDYRAALDRERMIRSAFEEQMQAVDGMAGTIAEYHVLRRDVASHLDLHADLQQKRKEAEVSAAAATAEVALVEAAIAPELPIRPVPKRDLPLAAVVGLLLGIGLAFLREYTDTAVHTADELHSVSEVPILGIIPSAAADLRRRNPERVVGRGGVASGKSLPPRGGLADGTSMLAEAFGGLRASVLFDVDARAPRSLLITSSQPGEGKTTVSMNLAMSLAKLGRRTLLIDADTRRPALHSAFGIEREIGLMDHLEAGRDWRPMVALEVAPGLDLLPAGCRSDSPSDALSSPRMRELVEEAQSEYDFVIIDSPALMINAADTRMLAPLVDGVLLVVRSGATSREAVRHVVGQTPSVIGVVLNDLDIRKFTSYYGPYDEPGASARGASGKSRRG